MPIKKRKRKIVIRASKPPKKTNAELLERMGQILDAGYGDEDMARTYLQLLARDHVARLQSIAARAETERNWNFMKGSIKQAADMYVLASILYERFPDHVMLSDGAYDYLSRFLLKHYKNTDPDFWSWYNITSIDLKAGTGSTVLARGLIPYMVKEITGVMIADDPAPRDRARKLRRKIIRGSKPPTERGGGRTTKAVPKAIRRKKPAKKNKAGKPNRTG